MIISDGGVKEFDLYQNVVAAGLVFAMYGGVIGEVPQLVLSLASPIIKTKIFVGGVTKQLSFESRRD